jgi:hypothetical protein
VTSDDDRSKQADDLKAVVGYIIGNHPELGYPKSASRWAGALRNRGERLNCALAEGTIRQILKGVAVLDGHNNPAVEYVPYELLGGLSATQLRFTLADFKAWEKQLGGRAPGQPDGPAGGLPLPTGRIRARYRLLAKTDDTAMLGHYELMLPARFQPRLTRDQEELHYVTWRYALETSPEAPRVAREVMSFRREGNAFHATMSYKFGAHDLEQVPRVFEGPVVPLGQSLMCLLTATDQTTEGWEDNFDRGRAIFMRRRPLGSDHFVRFAVMATTRAGGDFEPCAACVFMLLVDAKIEDIQEFRRLVTVVRPEEEILNSDFGGLPERRPRLMGSFGANGAPVRSRVRARSGAHVLGLRMAACAWAMGGPALP